MFQSVLVKNVHTNVPIPRYTKYRERTVASSVRVVSGSQANLEALLMTLPCLVASQNISSLLLAKLFKICCALFVVHVSLPLIEIKTWCSWSAVLYEIKILKSRPISIDCSGVKVPFIKEKRMAMDIMTASMKSA